MVFTARIDCDTRAKVYYLTNVKGFSTRKVAELCDVSRESVVRIGRKNRDTQALRLSNQSNDRGRAVLRMFFRGGCKIFSTDCATSLYRLHAIVYIYIVLYIEDYKLYHDIQLYK